jgi:tRNA A-37 threonylcarbamoyl transferase component Bud32/tetratricopeptide (TPR) repeat protein
MDPVAQLSQALADRYRIEREIGRGGMATVYLAHDLKHERQVAIKILKPELAASIGPERFLREIAITAQLDHPHILSLLDSGSAGPEPILYYVMPLVEGESLRDRLDRERQLPLAEAIQITREVAGALAYAHSRGVIHRDIKPENILLSNGHARVADFGIARAVATADSRRLTETGMAIGTPAYMSPEQATGGQHVDARSDIYALGCVLYEMIAGEPPFDGPTPQAILARALTESPRPLDVIRPGLPRSLETIIHRATARVPADRFQSGSQFAAELERLADRITQGSEPVLAGTHRFRRSALITVGGVLLAAILAGGVILREINGKVAPEPRASMATPAPAVVALYRRGARGYARRTAAGNADALAAFTAAAKADSTYSLAWSGLARTYVQAYARRFQVQELSWDSVVQLAVVSANAALAADSLSADAWLAQAMVSRLIDPTDVGPSIRAARKALLLDSTLAPAWHTLAADQAESGDFGNALESWRRSVAVTPTYTEGLAFLGLAHYWRREYDSAAVWADSAIALDPTYLLGRSAAGYIAIERGDLSRGIAAFDAARRLSTEVEVMNALEGSALAEARAGHRDVARALLQQTEDSVAAYVPPPLHTVVYRAKAYAALGDARRAVNWLSRYQPRQDLHFQLHLRCDPPFDPIASDPAFKALLTAPRPSKGC